MQTSRGTEAGGPAPVREPDRPATPDEEPDERDAELARLADRYKRALAEQMDAVLARQGAVRIGVTLEEAAPTRPATRPSFATTQHEVITWTRTV